VSALAIDGQGIGAISKVLALFVPEVVPLMPDRALVIETVSVEATAQAGPDRPTTSSGSP